MTRWDHVSGDVSGSAYAARFAALAKSGVDVHGEAAFCAALAPEGAAVLDAGCGTGRVAIELARRGFDVVGVDVSEEMLAVAREVAPELDWALADLADLDLGREFALIVAAGNVIPLVTPGSEYEVIRRLASHLGSGGLLVAGFGLDAAHLPLDQPPFGLAEYDDWCSRAGLGLVARYATWDLAPYDEADPAYAVNVHALGQ
jgi:SAM-dependent methyltransferase